MSYSPSKRLNWAWFRIASSLRVLIFIGMFLLLNFFTKMLYPSRWRMNLLYFPKNQSLGKYFCSDWIILEFSKDASSVLARAWGGVCRISYSYIILASLNAMKSVLRWSLRSNKHSLEFINLRFGRFWLPLQLKFILKILIFIICSAPPSGIQWLSWWEPLIFVQRYNFYIIYPNNCIYFLRKIVLTVRWDNVCICRMVIWIWFGSGFIYARLNLNLYYYGEGWA